MKKKQKIITGVVIVLIILGGLLIYWTNLPKDRCTSKDRQINNCVPAGKCGPTQSIDAVIDCDVKNYDKKFDPDI